MSTSHFPTGPTGSAKGTPRNPRRRSTDHPVTDAAIAAMTIDHDPEARFRLEPTAGTEHTLPAVRPLKQGDALGPPRGLAMALSGVALGLIVWVLWGRAGMISNPPGGARSGACGSLSRPACGGGFSCRGGG